MRDETQESVFKVSDGRRSRENTCGGLLIQKLHEGTDKLQTYLSIRSIFCSFFLPPLSYECITGMEIAWCLGSHSKQLTLTKTQALLDILGHVVGYTTDQWSISSEMRL